MVERWPGGGGVRSIMDYMGNKITLLSCPISLAFDFTFYSTLLTLVYRKIRLHCAAVCTGGPCIFQELYG